LRSELKGLVDMGDIVGCCGGIKRTDKGELSVVASWLQVLTKSLRPLPDKWHGLTHIEKRYRQR
jgi:lysyl-tRNA synthetase class 2